MTPRRSPQSSRRRGTGSRRSRIQGLPAAGPVADRRAAQSRIRLVIEPKVNYWGEPLPRTFPDHVIRSALLRRALAPDGFLIRALGNMPVDGGRAVQIQSADFDHFQEGDYQMVFRVRIRLAGEPRRRRLCVLVSKGDARARRIAAREHRLLCEWARRCPRQVIAPLASESIRLPASATGGGRPAGCLFVYATPWLDAFHELGVTADLRFFVNEHPLQRFGTAWTDRIKSRILALCWSLYDPETGIMPAPPLIGAGDIMITRPHARQAPDIRLIAARGIRRVSGLEDCLRVLLTYAGDWGDRCFRLRPDDPAVLWEAVREGLALPHGIPETRLRQALKMVLPDNG